MSGAKLMRRSGARGFTIIEVLIAVALLAAISAVMCSAVAATIDSCQVTRSSAESSARAKLALGQVASALRKANTLVLSSSTRLDMVDENNAVIAYAYDATTKQLNVEHGSPVVKSPLARDVKAVSFTAESEPDPETQVVRIVRLTLSITINAPAGGNGPGVQTYTMSAAPRRARSYQ